MFGLTTEIKEKEAAGLLFLCKKNHYTIDYYKYLQYSKNINKSPAPGRYGSKEKIMENIVNVTVDLSKLTEKHLEQLVYIVDDYDPGFDESLTQEIKERLKDGRIVHNTKGIPSDWDIAVGSAKDELEFEEDDEEE